MTVTNVIISSHTAMSQSHSYDIHNVSTSEKNLLNNTSYEGKKGSNQKVSQSEEKKEFSLLTELIMRTHSVNSAPPSSREYYYGENFLRSPCKRKARKLKHLG